MYNDIVPAASEFHQGAHLLEAIVKLNRKYIYEPLVHFLQIKCLNEPENAILAEDTVEQQAAKRAQRWIKMNKPSKLRGENEDLPRCAEPRLPKKATTTTDPATSEPNQLGKCPGTSVPTTP